MSPFFLPVPSSTVSVTFVVTASILYLHDPTSKPPAVTTQPTPAAASSIPATSPPHRRTAAHRIHRLSSCLSTTQNADFKTTRAHFINVVTLYGNRIPLPLHESCTL
jgi:hypothetical protein